MGRGVAAAAAMAEMRAAIRAFASIDPDPAFVLHKLDQMVGAYGSDQLVTLVYVLADADRGQLLVGNAGHHPRRCSGRRVGRAAAVRRRAATGDARRRPGAGDRPFGVGDTLLAFTDGLIERRDEDIDTGLERLGPPCRPWRGPARQRRGPPRRGRARRHLRRRHGRPGAAAARLGARRRPVGGDRRPVVVREGAPPRAGAGRARRPPGIRGHPPRSVPRAARPRRRGCCGRRCRRRRSTSSGTAPGSAARCRRTGSGCSPGRSVRRVASTTLKPPSIACFRRTKQRRAARASSRRTTSSARRNSSSICQPTSVPTWAIAASAASGPWLVSTACEAAPRWRAGTTPCRSRPRVGPRPAPAARWWAAGWVEGGRAAGAAPAG